MSPNICSSYHVVSSAVYRQWTPTSKHKANFSNISASQKGFIQELQMCVYIESATQLLYWRLVLLHCRQAIHSLWTRFLAVASITTSSLVFTLQVRSAELSSAVRETREWNPGNFNISHCRHLRRLRLRRVPITGECQESNFVSASSQLPIDYWHWPTPGTFIIQSHQTEMGLLLLNSPRIVCAYLLAAAKVDSWASMYCRYLQNNLIFLHTAL